MPLKDVDHLIRRHKAEPLYLFLDMQDLRKYFQRIQSLISIKVKVN